VARLRDDVEVNVAERTVELHAADDEVAALRRVATLVVQGVPSAQIFSAVSDEVSRLFGSDISAVVRFERDGTATVMGVHGESQTPGARVELEAGYVISSVRTAGRAVRFDTDDPEAAGMPEIVRALGIHSGLASPIVVEGEVWGAITLASLGRPLPKGMERRLADFTELVATALANAQAREARSLLAEEQAALRRVATLVARGAPAEELFAAVVAEVAGLLPVSSAAMGRYEPDGTVTTVAAWSAGEVAFTVGNRWQAVGNNVTAIVARTGRPARLNDFADASGPIGVHSQASGYRSAVGSPIVVVGRLWGVITAASTAEDPLPAETEGRLASFTELVATAIANADSRSGIARLADEQAALRQVAVLVAQQPSPDEVFTAVTEAVGRLLGADLAAMHVFPGDGAATTIAGWSAAGPMLPIGTLLPLDGDSVAARIFHTCAAARMDTYSDVDGETAETARGLRLRSTVGAPILVDGALWGALMAATRGSEPLPEDAETRIAAFTELVATAVSNAEARENLHRLADEQAALRRVATLVAEDAPATDLFRAVTREVGVLLGADFSGMARFDRDGAVTTATWAAEGDDPPIPDRWQMQPGDPATAIAAARRAVRWDDWTQVAGPASEFIKDELGVRSTVGAPIVVEGRLWGLLAVHSKQDAPLPPDTESRLQQFTDLVATAIANAESKSELAASRRRIVAASDEARRRIERDLHDGTQQRLVSLGLAVRAAEANVPHDRDDLRSELHGIAVGLGAAVEELQELSRGIHPAILSQGGLGPAVRTLARRSAVPVELDLVTDTRLPPAIEVAAYYVVSEALANAAKHAQAARIEVSLALRDNVLRLAIRDDGVGGADPVGGSGLVGMTDRLEALGGSIRVESPPGEGTHITAALPL
jgi:GAF domain-containing protein